MGVSVAGETVADTVERHTADCGLDVTHHHGQNAELLASAELTLVASGTATLEVAYYGSPMIVMYKASRLLYHLFARRALRIQHYSLINILAGRPLVPEFMPYFASVDPIVRAVESMVAEPETLARISNELIDMVEPMTTKRAREEVADVVCEMLR